MELNVLGIPVKIVKIADLKDEFGKPIDADYSAVKATIKIDSKLRGKGRIHALIHELGHAVIDILGAHNCELSHDLEELIVDNIGRVVAENFELRGRK
jgi:hypothetical protein